jgi:Ser-tRNA(Ala) deacylase AlaX
MVTSQNILVTKSVYKREEAEKEFDLSKIPLSVNEVRIVEIKGFDRRPCKDPHVDNTKEIGYFKLTKIEKAGKDRYRIIFEVKS